MILNTNKVLVPEMLFVFTVRDVLSAKSITLLPWKILYLSLTSNLVLHKQYYLKITYKMH